MTLNIKNLEVEALVKQVVYLTGESKTEAVRQALAERIDRLSTQRFVAETKQERLCAFLEEEVWPNVDPEHLGKGISQAEQDEILGYEEFGI